tara:strand:+ start:191 stop:316 length:126 start_codon:yes stop_codon:yes gene_type:complete
MWAAKEVLGFQLEHGMEQEQSVHSLESAVSEELILKIRLRV